MSDVRLVLSSSERDSGVSIRVGVVGTNSGQDTSQGAKYEAGGKKMVQRRVRVQVVQSASDQMRDAREMGTEQN